MHIEKFHLKILFSLGAQATNRLCMEIEITEQDELIIQRLLDTGAYSDRASVVNAALAALERREKQSALDDAIQQGLDNGVDEGFRWSELKTEAQATLEGN